MRKSKILLVGKCRIKEKLRERRRQKQKAQEKKHNQIQHKKVKQQKPPWISHLWKHSVRKRGGLILPIL